MGTIVSRIFTKPFLITILRYALTAVGAWLSANKGFDPGAWETIAGSLLVIATTLMGGAESVKDKVTIDGKSVAASNLPAATKSQVEAAVSVKKSRSILDILLGK